MAAQVAVTLAGFAGIVVVLRPDSVHQWSALDRFRGSLLLMNSALPLGLAIKKATSDQPSPRLRLGRPVTSDEFRILKPECGALSGKLRCSSSCSRHWCGSFG